jgi:hypothetical protein
MGARGEEKGRNGVKRDHLKTVNLWIVYKGIYSLGKSSTFTSDLYAHKTQIIAEKAKLHFVLIKYRDTVSRMSSISSGFPLITHGIALILGILVLAMSFFIGSFHFIKLLLQTRVPHLGGFVLDAKVSGDGWDVNL